MIDTKLFLFGSIIIYFILFYILQKLKIPYFIKILFTGLLAGGVYYNIAMHGIDSKTVHQLHISYTPEIGFISGVMTFLYLVTGTFYLKDDR